jgi:hypothetical protein
MEIASAPTPDLKAANFKLVGQINDLKSKHTSDLAALRKQLNAAHEGLTLQQVAIDDQRRQLQERATALRDLQAVNEGLRTENADLRRRLQACDNVNRLIAEVARGDPSILTRGS